MEENTPITETAPKPKKSPSPWLILGGVWLCLSCAVVLCGGGALLIREGGNMPALFSTPVPTVDIIKVTTDDPMWKLIVDDSFDGNDNEWPVNSYENDSVRLNRKIENSKYIWDFQAKNGWSFYGFPDLKKFTDVVVSAEFKHTQGSPFDGYGFLLRASSGEHYYFSLSEFGHYTFGYRANDENHSLLEGETKSIRQGQFNQITVKAEGTRFTIYLNNTQIADVEDDTFSSGWVGVLLSPSGLPGGENNSNQQDTSFSLQQTDYPSSFEVDNFKVWISAADNTINKGTPLPPLTPDPGRLVFVSSRDGNREIYTIDTKGNNLNRLTNNPAEDYSPAWSPNGWQIAFVSSRNGNPDIYMMNSDGSEITRLTEDPASDLDPVWSPDGKKIIFTSSRGGDNNNLYVLDVETKTVERLTDAASNDRYPDWSPDGKTILFQSDRDFGVNFYTLDMETRKVKRISFDTTSSTSHPVWSPDGLMYAFEKDFSSGTGIQIKEFPNKNPFTVIGAYLQMHTWVAWSPDGSQIAFVSNREESTDIYIVSIDGKAIYRLTNDSAIESELDWTE